MKGRRGGPVFLRGQICRNDDNSMCPCPMMRGVSSGGISGGCRTLFVRGRCVGIVVLPRLNKHVRVTCSGIGRHRFICCGRIIGPTLMKLANP